MMNTRILVERLSVGSLLVAAALWALPGEARANDSADLHLRRGVLLLSHEKEEQALEEFRAAYAISPSPKAALEMGLVESTLGHWLDAEAHLAEGLRADTDDWVKLHRSLMEEQLAKVRSHLGWLTVTGTPKTEVVIDGAVVGTLPLVSPRMRRTEGPARVQGRLDGYPTIVKDVEVRGEGEHRVRLEFAAPVRPLAVAGMPTPSPAPVPPPNSAPKLSEPAEEAAPRGMGYQALPWLTIAVGIAGGVNAQMLDFSRHQCGVSGTCGPNNALLIGTAVASGLAIGIGIDALAVKAGLDIDPRIVKPVLVATLALAAAADIVSGAAMLNANGYGSDSRKDVGAVTLATGGIALALDVLIMFEKTPERTGPKVAITPMPGGFALLGAF